MKRMDYNFAHSAQGMLKQSEKPAACGAACGAGDKPAEEKPAACGTATVATAISPFLPKAA